MKSEFYCGESAKETPSYKAVDLEDARAKLNQDCYTPIDGSKLSDDEISLLGHDLARSLRTGLLSLLGFYETLRIVDKDFGGLRRLRDSLK